MYFSMIQHNFSFMPCSSGGKDSCYNMMQCVAAGHQIVALANLRPADTGEEKVLLGLMWSAKACLDNIGQPAALLHNQVIKKCSQKIIIIIIKKNPIVKKRQLASLKGNTHASQPSTSLLSSHLHPIVSLHVNMCCAPVSPHWPEHASGYLPFCSVYHLPHIEVNGEGAL